MPRARRTRSILIAGVASALALLAVPAQAGSSGAQLRDPAGDMPVPSLDIVSGAIQLATSGTSRTLTMTATMAGDLTGVPADYDLVTGTRLGNTCYALATRVRWNGVALVQSYQQTTQIACTNDVTVGLLSSLAGDMAQYAVTGDPVDATAAGRTVKVTLPAPAWLRPGSLASYGVLSHTPVAGFSSYTGVGQFGNYDLAGIDHEWRVG